MMKTLCVLLLSLLLSGQAWANDEARLNELKQEIAKLNAQLQKTQKESGQVTEALRQSDKDISDLLKKIEETRAKLSEGQERLKKLRQEQGQLRELELKHRAELSKQVRAAQQVGQDGPVKLLLNQDDPQQAQRMLRFFSYFNQARVKQIQQVVQELTRLEQIATLIKDSEAELLQNERQQLQNQRALVQKKAQQQQVLARLKDSISSSAQQIAAKEANRKVLEKLITEVKTLLDNSPRKNDARPFASLKGKLPAPVAGRVLQGFGSAIADTSRRQEGWLIATQEGSKVRAIHHGRVVYSDWLRGYGLILLIDHGQGYLSLYAHNQSLLRDVGNWVNQGDVIASAGHSGGNDSSALYFEIRYNGRPQNPASWIQH